MNLCDFSTSTQNNPKMGLPPLWLTTVLLCFVCNFPASADDASAPTRPESNPTSQTGAQRDMPVYLRADKIEGRTGQSAKARGAVEVQQGGLRLLSDELEYFEATNEVTGEGKVRFERDGDAVEGERFRYDLDSAEGFIEKPNYSLAKKADRKFAARGSGALIRFLGEEREQVSLGTYTTCAPGQDDWFLRVRDLDLDRDTEVGEAHNATVVFKGVPIFYMPWATFPLSNKRKSGFLTPTFGTTGRSGFEAEVPYYWNIAPNLDATFAPRILSKRGLQMQNEFRYLYPNFRGEAQGDILPNDRQLGEHRYFFKWLHAQTLPAGWSAGVNLQKASDDNYFRDLTTRIAQTSQTNLPRDITFRYGDPTWTFSLQQLSYQTLEDPTNPTGDRPYRLRPQAILTGDKRNYRGIDLHLYGEATDFGHPSQAEGKRFIAYPEASYPLQTSYAFVTPKLGYHYTRYALERNPLGPTDISRGLPIVSVDSGLIFERELAFRERAYRQTLEPRLFYVNIPFKDQSQIPRLSTGLLDFGFAQIFSENQFIGGDRINDANQVTAGVASRFIESDSGAERLRAAIAQRYYFTEPRVTLDGPNVPLGRKSSDVLLGLSGMLSPRWSIDGGWQFDPRENKFERVSYGVRYSPAPGKVLNASYRSASVTSIPPAGIPAQIDLSAQWPITRNWYALGRVNYSIDDGKLLEGLAGLEYTAGCWEVRIVAHRFTTAEQLVSTSFFIQLELNGLSRFGTNPLEALRQNIPGYIKSQEINP